MTTSSLAQERQHVAGDQIALCEVRVAGED
jgi:hypothetical protein